MNTLFLINEVIKPSSGISKKILSQVKALNLQSDSCYFSCLDSLDNKLIRRVNEKIIDNYLSGSLGKIQSFVHFSSLYDFIVLHNVDVVYIRYTHYANPIFNHFLKKLSRVGVKTFIEIPTFPYDHEYKCMNSFSKLKLFVDKCYREKISKYIHRFVTFSNDDFIWGKQTLKISNAVDPDLAPLSNSTFDGKSLIFVGVANLATWHGYDRLIRSIAKFYLHDAEKLTDVFFYVVGDGIIYSELKTLATSLGIDKYINFFGALDGAELDEVFDKANVGVDSLGRHRSGSFYNNSLKSKEYLVRGLPIIKSHIDHTLLKSKFCFDVEPDESEIDLEKVITWYIHNEFSNKKVRNNFVERFSWVHQFNTIFNSIER